jgi:hypothetical protein
MQISLIQNEKGFWMWASGSKEEKRRLQKWELRRCADLRHLSCPHPPSATFSHKAQRIRYSYVHEVV